MQNKNDDIWLTRASLKSKTAPDKEIVKNNILIINKKTYFLQKLLYLSGSTISIFCLDIWGSRRLKPRLKLNSQMTTHFTHI